MNDDCVYDPDGYCMHVDGMVCPRRWQPSGYVNVYRLPPYEDADIFERLTGVACWSNELNEMARRGLSSACWLLVGSIGMLLLVLLYASAERLS
jgi:hypothetical protein